MDHMFDLLCVMSHASYVIKSHKAFKDLVLMCSFVWFHLKFRRSRLCMAHIRDEGLIIMLQHEQSVASDLTSF